MRFRRPRPRALRWFAAGVAIGAVLAAAPAASAATVTGKLAGGARYTVVALRSDGSATTAKAKAGGRFKLTLSGARARGAVLQLVRPGGTYFGPIVLRAKRRRAYMHLAGFSVKLGTVRLKRGYGAPVRPVSAGAPDTGPPARTDSRGRPVGAGRLGLVRRAGVRSSQNGKDSGPGDDADDDGIPAVYDVDDDGDEVLDQTDPSGAPSGAPATGISPFLSSTLFFDIEDSLNANAAGVSDASIEALIRDQLSLGFGIGDTDFPGRTVSAVNVDCSRLAYCRPGAGTATVFGPTTGSALSDLPFGKPWTDYDTDRDGLPNLYRQAEAATHTIVVKPRVGSSQIAPGDSFVFVADVGGQRLRVPASLGFILVTSPALASYDDGTGAKAVGYPVAAGAPLTRENPAPVASGKVKLTFWRPQRPAIPGAERRDLTDIGHLRYGVFLGLPGGRDARCTIADYSALSADLEPSGTVPAAVAAAEVLRDRADDASPDPGRTLSFTIDIAACVRRAGADPAGAAISVGLKASDEKVDNADQLFSFKLP